MFEVGIFCGRVVEILPNSAFQAETHFPQFTLSFFHFFHWLLPIIYMAFSDHLRCTKMFLGNTHHWSWQILEISLAQGCVAL